MNRRIGNIKLLVGEMTLARASLYTVDTLYKNTVATVKIIPNIVYVYSNIVYILIYCILIWCIHSDSIGEN